LIEKVPIGGPIVKKVVDYVVDTRGLRWMVKMKED
jgi:hypothetical protein